GAESSRQRVELIQQGFQDRELRYRADISMARDRLLSYAKDHRQVAALLQRMVEDLNLLRDNLDEAQQELQRQQRNVEEDEARNMGKLAELSGDRKVLESRLAELQEQGEFQDRETGRLRVRAERVREGVVNELEA
ncbi:unnamed protein product, partial [Polarella glacialis]